MKMQGKRKHWESLLFFDTHCHLDFSVFDHERDSILQRCALKGIDTLCIPSVHFNNIHRVITLAHSPAPILLLYGLGLHPCFIQSHEQIHLDTLEKQLNNRDTSRVAIGEIGLDFVFSTDKSERDKQLAFFDAQLQLARAYQYPVIIHARKTHDLILKRLRAVPLLKGGIIHGFSGSEQQARQYIEQGFKLGFGGGVTYERARKTRYLATRLPLESLVLETDAPDMPLSGFQGQSNTPLQLPVIAQTIAQLRGESLKRITEQTTLNAQQLFTL